MRRAVYIYALCEPCGEAVRYVGQSTKPAHRYEGHLKEKARTHKVHWIQSVLAQGKKPVLKILDTISDCTEKQWQKAERFWINKMAGLGHRLTNADPGGIGTTMSFDTRRRIAETLKGRKRPEISKMFTGRKASSLAKKNMSKAQKRRFKKWSFSSEAIERIRLSSAGRKLSSEHKEKLRLANVGRVVSLETRARFSYLARNRSPETRAKISLANTGRKLTEEHKRKVGLSLKGHPVSDSTREKIRLAAIRQHSRAGHKMKVFP